MYRPEAIIFGAEPESGGFALCIDSHGHGLYVPSDTLHDVLDERTRAMFVMNDEQARSFLGEPLAAFLAALASHTYLST